MSHKYSPRCLPSVSRDLYATDNEPDDSKWYNAFLENLQKNSMPSQSSIYDDIAAIMNNKSKFSNVEEAVNDMRQRTGLDTFLKIKASLQQLPEIFQKIPRMKAFIDNFIEARPGTSVESVVHDLLKLDDIREQLPNKTDVEPDVRAYINGKIAEIGMKKVDTNSADMHLGKVEQSQDIVVDDPLAICEPTKQNSF